MEVKIISTETVNPSSPTPSHLTTFKLSLIDQFYPANHVQAILYYPPPPSNTNNNTTKQLLASLKTSFSHTLSRFYPLAGRIKDHLSIDCNDEGALFSVAQVTNCHLSEFLKQPPTDLLDLLVPIQAHGGPAATVQFAVQVNIFSCGGIAIGVSGSHKVMDGATLVDFFKCWAAFNVNGYCDDKSSTLGPNLKFNASSIFPPREEPLAKDMAMLKLSWLLRKGKGVCKRFVFDAASIAALKAKATSQQVPNPSRVLVVLAFLWKCINTANRFVTGGSQPSTLSMAVNLRSRMEDPSLLQHTIGNVIWQLITHHDQPMESQLTELQCLVVMLKEGNAKINGDFMRSLQGDGGYSFICNFIEEMDKRHCQLEKKLDFYMSIPWWKIGFNEVDFGWGKPVWLSPLGGVRQPVFVNQLTLVETNGGDGIEAWLLLDEQVIGTLENDPEFLSFASLNPRVFARL